MFRAGHNKGVMSKLKNHSVVGGFIATIASPVVFTGLAIVGTTTRLPSAMKDLFVKNNKVGFHPLSFIKKWTGMDDSHLKNTVYPFLSGAIIGTTFGVATGATGLVVGR